MTIMNKEEKRMMLFDMQEHPEKYTDEQIESLLAEEEVKDFFTEVVMARMAGKKAKPDLVDVDEAWKKFSKRHISDEANEVFSDEASHVSDTIGRRLYHSRRMKVAASIIGVVFLSGVAWATAVHQGWIHGFSFSDDSKPTEQVEQLSASSALSADSIKTATMEAKKDSTLDMKPVVFDNAELKDVLSQFASFYQVKVEYANADAQHVRLFFNWDKQKPLQKNIEILNAFDRINISLNDGILKVD